VTHPAGSKVRRLWLAAGFSIGIAASAAPIAALAAAQPTPDPASRTIAVSVPTDPVLLSPGEASQIPLRVVDPTPRPVSVTVTGRAVTLGDNGQVGFASAPDPSWATRAQFPTGDLTVPAMGFLDVTVTVRMPAVISPDLYYVGFVVRPVGSGPGVTIINEIGGFFTIDVPGPRVRNLSADLGVAGFNLGPIHLSNLVIGDRVVGRLNVHNTGTAAIRFWGENDDTSWFASTPTQLRLAKSLLPIARSRSFPVSAEPGMLVDLVTMSVTVTYPGTTESTTKQVVITKTVLVISPWLLVVVCLVIAGVVGWRLRARQRRRARARLNTRGVPRRSARVAPRSPTPKPSEDEPERAA
jgi:hypothetical protein